MLVIIRQSQRIGYLMLTETHKLYNYIMTLTYITM